MMYFLWCLLWPGAGIALFPGRAKLLSCRHHYHDYIPPLVDPGKPQEGDCNIVEVTYLGPFTNETEVSQGKMEITHTYRSQ